MTLTSYSPCFRKEKGAHGIEERGVYRIHQFEKQEMIVVCKPEESMDWYEKMWQLHRGAVPLAWIFRCVTLECCSGDLADLKVKSCDVEAWSPTPAEVLRGLLLLQPRRCAGSPPEDPRTRARTARCYLAAHAEQHRRRTAAYAYRIPREPPAGRWQRRLIPEVLRPYMGGTEVLIPKK